MEPIDHCPSGDGFNMPRRPPIFYNSSLILLPHNTNPFVHFIHTPYIPALMATRSARTVDKTINDKHARILKALLHKPENKYCVDCRRKGIPTILNCSDVSFSLIPEEMSWFRN